METVLPVQLPPQSTSPLKVSSKSNQWLLLVLGYLECCPALMGCARIQPGSQIGLRIDHIWAFLVLPVSRYNSEIKGTELVLCVWCRAFEVFKSDFNQNVIKSKCWRIIKHIGFSDPGECLWASDNHLHGNSCLIVVK